MSERDLEIEIEIEIIIEDHNNIEMTMLCQNQILFCSVFARGRASPFCKQQSPVQSSKDNLSPLGQTEKGANDRNDNNDMIIANTPCCCFRFLFFLLEKRETNDARFSR